MYIVWQFLTFDSFIVTVFYQVANFNAMFGMPHCLMSLSNYWTTFASGLPPLPIGVNPDTRKAIGYRNGQLREVYIIDHRHLSFPRIPKLVI